MCGSRLRGGGNLAAGYGLGAEPEGPGAARFNGPDLKIFALRSRR